MHSCMHACMHASTDASIHRPVICASLRWSVHPSIYKVRPPTMSMPHDEPAQLASGEDTLFGPGPTEELVGARRASRTPVQLAGDRCCSFPAPGPPSFPPVLPLFQQKQTNMSIKSADSRRSIRGVSIRRAFNENSQHAHVKVQGSRHSV